MGALRCGWWLEAGRFFTPYRAYARRTLDRPPDGVAPPHRQSPNVLLTADLRAKVADFGLARVCHTSITANSATNTPTGTFHW